MSKRGRMPVRLSVDLNMVYDDGSTMRMTFPHFDMTDESASCEISNGTPAVEYEDHVVPIRSLTRSGRTITHINIRGPLRPVDDAVYTIRTDGES